jgi:hypothetical protein
MFNKKTVRSVFAVLAVLGMAACSQGTGSGAGAVAPARSTDGTTILSQEVTQKASIKLASVTDEAGQPVAIESSTVLGQVSAIDRAIVSKEVVQAADGSAAERMVIDLGDVNGSIVKFHGDSAMTNLSVVTGGFPASHAEVAMAEGQVASMLMRIEDGRALNVVLAFGAEQKQDNGNQDDGKQEQNQDQKQDEPKQDQPKQDQPKQDQPKQDQPKQDQPKQDQPKQDQPKQDQPKQDQPKQDQPKQDQPKQDQPKQDQPKQDQPKQDQPKQDQPKQDQPKQDQPKQDQPKQDQPKQDQPKQDQPKQDQPKQEQPKQEQPKQG